MMYRNDTFRVGGDRAGLGKPRSFKAVEATGPVVRRLLFQEVPNVRLLRPRVHREGRESKRLYWKGDRKWPLGRRKATPDSVPGSKPESAGPKPGRRA